VALWIDRLEEAPRGLHEAIVWVAFHAEAAGWSLPRASPDDLADAALARRDGGGPRLLRRRMLRALAARVLDLHPDRVRFVRDAQGAPGLADPPAYLSTSGCRDHSAVVLSPYPVGVDIESRSEPGDLRRWTRLEATLKAHGRGLHDVPVPPRLSDTREHPAYVVTVVSRIQNRTATCRRGGAGLAVPARASVEADRVVTPVKA
jgi:phosphopantetheinyl transferase